MLHAGYESIHYSAILCPPRLYLSDVHPVTSTRTDGMPVCVCVCVCMLVVLPSTGPHLKWSHTHISRDQFIPLPVSAWINEGGRNWGMKEWEQRMRRERGKAKIGVYERGELRLFTCVLCVYVCVSVFIYHLWPRSANIDPWVFEGGGGGTTKDAFEVVQLMHTTHMKDHLCTQTHTQTHTRTETTAHPLTACPH